MVETEVSRRWIAALTGAALISALVLLPVSSATAYDRVGGVCRKNASVADFGTYYTLTGGYNQVSWFEWYLQNWNGLGNKSNVNIRHYRNVVNAPDQVVYSWNSPDSQRPYVWTSHFPYTYAETRDGAWAHTNFRFIFDNWGNDDDCQRDTPDFR